MPSLEDMMYVGRLGRAKIGKSCVMFRKLENLDEEALVAFIKETAEMGLVARALMASGRRSVPTAATPLVTWWAPGTRTPNLRMKSP